MIILAASSVRVNLCSSAACCKLCNNLTNRNYVKVPSSQKSLIRFSDSFATLKASNNWVMSSGNGALLQSLGNPNIKRMACKHKRRAFRPHAYAVLCPYLSSPTNGCQYLNHAHGFDGYADKEMHELRWHFKRSATTHSVYLAYFFWNAVLTFAIGQLITK